MRMDLGLDETLFDEATADQDRNRPAGLSSGYSVRQTPREWFLREDADDLQTLKFRCDNLYWRRRFHDALPLVEAALAQLGRQRNCVWRDLTEMQARCLLRLGRLTEAWDVCASLGESCQSDDQLLALFNLHHDIHCAGDDREGLLLSLVRLLLLLPSSGALWWRYLAARRAVSTNPDDRSSQVALYVAAMRARLCLAQNGATLVEARGVDRHALLEAEVEKELASLRAGLGPDVAAAVDTVLTPDLVFVALPSPAAAVTNGDEALLLFYQTFLREAEDAAR